MFTRFLHRAVVLMSLTFAAGVTSASGPVTRALDATPASQPSNAHGVTTGSLIGAMADLDALTRHPGAGVRVVQFSSYDRRSRSPEGPGWFGNADGFGNEAIPGFESVARDPGADGVGEYVICDVSQPGAIVRTWTAAIEGTIRVYLDGAATPVYEGSAYDFLMHKTAKLAEAAGLSQDEDVKAALPAFEQRYSDYLPIPFAKSCRITWVGDLRKVHFYHVQLKLYPSGTPVTTFSLEDLKLNTRSMRSTATVMLAGAAGGSSSLVPALVTQSLEHGQVQEVMKLGGAGAIRRFEASIKANDLPAALRGTLLKIAFDGHEAPQIVSPLGDFFGVAPGAVPFNTLPVAVKPDGTLVCTFVMPFESSAVITLENHAWQKVEVSLAVYRDEYRWTDRSMHLRAHWLADHDLTARGGAQAVDLPFLTAFGEGTYVGTAVYLMNPCPIPTAGGNWWGEGDEKVYVDGEGFPSIFGTGSEDYFNYAWSEGDVFQYPYFAQPICTGPDTRGHITNTRWHILDAIPFDRSIVFAMELFAHTPTPQFSYARMSYWYGRPGAHDTIAGINTSDLRVPPLLPWTVRAAGGATNATIAEAEAGRDVQAPISLLYDIRYSGGRAVRFHDGRGRIDVDVPSAGKYNVVITAPTHVQPLSFRASINGIPLTSGEKPDFTLAPLPFTKLVNLWSQAVDLPAGKASIEFGEFKSDSGESPVVDFVWLRPSR